jgi:bifunctional DNA-binding transcriptional regulator/antitoxin component of YhaV-PrlF toxin-antitoxin module
MRYFGIARKERGQVVLPDAFREVEEGHLYEVVEIGGDILLMPPPLDRERLAQIECLANRSIEEHRKSLEGLSH